METKDHSEEGYEDIQSVESHHRKTTCKTYHKVVIAECKSGDHSLGLVSRATASIVLRKGTDPKGATTRYSHPFGMVARVMGLPHSSTTHMPRLRQRIAMEESTQALVPT